MDNKHYHLVGIKGVGMTALAGILKGKGVIVSGSDTGESFVTDLALERLGVDVSAGFDQINITKKIEVVVYSGAYSIKDNPELIQAKDLGIPIYTQQEMLVDLVKDKKVIAVAGVGGKTTVAAMLAMIFRGSGRDLGYFIGAGVINHNKPPGRWGEDEYFVVEADEYANSIGTDNTPKLLLLDPLIVIIPNLRFDHPDIYKDEQDTIDTFRTFLAKVPADGAIYINAEDKLTEQVLDGADIKAKITSIGTHSGDWRISTTSTTKDVIKGTVTRNGQVHELTLNLVGIYNLFNGALAAIVAKDIGLEWSQILSTLAGFKGIGRRQQFIGKVNDILLYDDYAHHPHEISATIISFKKQFPDRRLWILFESHTYTRTQALLPDFIKALGESDVVSIMPIFSSAREDKSDFNLSENSIAEELRSRGVLANALSFKDAPKYIADNATSQDIILTMGAGKVYELHEEIIQALKGVAPQS